MVALTPIPALRPVPERAADVAAVPYDVVSTDEARALAAGNPHSFLHVTRPEIDLPPGTDPHGEEVYALGRRRLERMRAEEVLLRDPVPALYPYRLIAGDHEQVGIMAAVSVDDYDAGRIKLHEKTRPDKEDDRTRHLVALGCHPEPVFLTYRATADVDERVAEIVEQQAPLYDFTAPDGVRHTMWRDAAHEGLVAAFAAVPALYVADGHHRSAAASRARAELARERGPGPWDRFLATVFPHDQVRILPYNRLVRDLGGLTPQRLLDRLHREMARVEPIGGPGDAAAGAGGRGRFAMYLAGRWHRLTAPAALVEAPDPVESLDAAILQRAVLAPILGVDDPRTSERLDFVGGGRGTAELERRVDSGEAAVAFALHPLSVDQLLAVADAGRVLPPKSTWFEPKLRSGLIVHELG
ncbi:MAG TPA: DUF1015 family protein [Thermoanaerobaculia bacterium]|nr:DUF1015 family protein [Thermoanaerobaculia bacterium]